MQEDLRSTTEGIHVEVLQLVFKEQERNGKFTKTSVTPAHVKKNE